ncbi:MAG: 30S ribosomal protein S20 [Planctomycetes bacterium]|nr:30S ribosomal protein S20 [Planctomycetota bacterium]
MPHSLSAKKRVRQNERRRVYNRTVKSRIRTARRAFAKALEARDPEAARQRLRACERLLHRAANRGPLHRNASARLISRMQGRLAALEKAAAAN